MDKVRSHLKVIGGDQAFQTAYARANPGDLNKGIGGGLKRMQLWKSTKDYLKSVATLSISSWAQAIRSQDKARRFTFAQEQMPSPTARLMAGAMMDSFDADAYAKGMNAAITTVSLPVTLQGFASGAGVAGALVPANLSAGIHATSTGLVHGLSHSTAGTGGNIGWGNWGHEVAVGQTKAAILDPHELRQARNPVQMPTIPVKMRSGAVKDVKLTDKHTAMALLIYLGRSVDHAKVTRGDAREISRRNLRLELFHAGDDEHLQLAEKTGKVETDSAGRKENERLMEALFYEDTESREAILARARPMKKLFAAAGLLETPSFRERFQPASNGPG